MSEEVVQEYARAMKAGAVFPPLVVFGNDDCLILADGFHRYEAAPQAGRIAFDCEVRPGGVREAILYAAAAKPPPAVSRR
jgi:hypothetical protein